MERDGLRTNDKGYKDYGLLPGEEKRLKSACRRRDPDIQNELISSAYQANEEIAMEIVYSLFFGKGYDVLSQISYIPMSRNSFYGYRRKCLAIFKDKLIRRKIQY